MAEVTYLFWCKVFGVFGGVLAIALLLAQVAFSAYRWIDDGEQKVVPAIERAMIKIHGDKYYSIGEFCFAWVVTVFGVGAAMFAWPVIVPGLLIYGCLYSIRHFKRFQKKIKEALGSKADKEHKHNQDDIVLNN